MIQSASSSSMNFLPKSSTFISTNYLIITFFHFVTGDKPRCLGDPLNPQEFSKPGDVGFVRDLCVDVIAREINNRFQLPVSSSCNELANMRTSTCFPKNVCVKWKRSYLWNTCATKRVTIKAEEMIEQLDNAVSKDVLLNNYEDEKFVFERINDAESRLVSSKAATQNSKIIESLQSLKKYCCTRSQFGQHQREYLRLIGLNDPDIMEGVDKLEENEDLGLVIKIFMRNFEAENAVKIIKFRISNPISRTVEDIMIGIPRLIFEFQRGTDTQSSSVIMKIPSLYSVPDEQQKQNMFDHELHFYSTVLPKLYLLGSCKPFSAKFYAATDTKAFIIEDFRPQGYVPGSAAKQLDLDQIHKSLFILAKYHALGYKYLQTLSKNDSKMPFIKSYQPIFMNRQIKKAFSLFLPMLEPFLNEVLYKKILELENEILAAPKTTKYPEENSMTVMIHADYRTNNILFQKDDTSKVIQAKIIDWQLSGEANPVLDLIYFFITSVPIEIFQANDDALQNSYLNTLNQVLSSIQSNRFYYRPELDRDMLYYKYYYLRVLFTNWPIIMLGASPINEAILYYQSSAVKWVNYFTSKGII